jgi:glycine dehydrogenase subunit 1
MACRVTQRERVAIAAGVNPRYRRVVETYLGAQGIGIDLDFDPSGTGLTDAHACLVLQSPDYYGRVALRDSAIAERVHAAGAVLVVSADPMAAALFRPPGELGADIVVGEGQSLGLPLNFGGPYLGLFTTRMEYVRNMPGRIVGQTSDLDGRRAFVLTLQAREQHIRRERAVSNICTNEQLLVLAVTVYLSLMGKQGLRKVARAAYDKAHYLAEAVAKLPGWALSFPDTPFFCEFSADAPLPADEVNRRLREQDIVGGIGVSDGSTSRVIFCTTETNSRAEIDRLVEALGGMRA